MTSLRTASVLLCWALASCSADDPAQTTFVDDPARAPDAAAALDAGLPDPAPGPDAATPATAPDAAASPPARPETLADTGLFATGSSGALAPGVMPYAPRYALWSDGAEKERWLYLPEGTQIDTSDMDHWSFPVGTKAWKLFSRDGKKLETRLLWKTAQGWFRAAYAWNDAETEAVAVPNGASDVRGTSHDIPKRGDCDECHADMPDRLLGVSAIQLSSDGPGATLASLAAAGKLTAPPPAGGYPLAATPAWDALGYLHANCGICHNPGNIAYDRVNLDLWLRVGQLDAPESTESWATSVGVQVTETNDPDLTLRIAPGDSDASAMIRRMLTRGSDRAMPPLASEQVDADGIATVRAFIDGLP